MSKYRLNMGVVNSPLVLTLILLSPGLGISTPGWGEAFLFTGDMAKKAEKKPKLTDLEERCCREYIVNGGNQSQAYRDCHKPARRWKDTTIWTRASELFAKPHVQLYLNELRAQAKAIADVQMDISIERVLKEYARIAFGDIRKIFSKDGMSLLRPDQLDNDTAAAIASLEVVANHSIETDEDGEMSRTLEYIHKYKTCDKLKALDGLAKYLHLFEERAVDEEESVQYGGTRIPGWMKEMIPGAES